MARFKFNLEGVLRLRTQVERDRQRVLAEKHAMLTQLTDELRRLDAQVQLSVADVRQNRLTGPLDLGYLAAHRRYTLAMHRRAIEQARRIVTAQQSVEQTRAELAEAAKQKKVIEKLKEKRLTQWRLEQAQKEMAQLDEIGMQIAYDNVNGNSREITESM